MNISITIAPDADADAAVLYEGSGVPADPMHAVLLLRHPGWEDPAPKQRGLGDIAIAALDRLRKIDCDPSAGIAHALVEVLRLAHERAIGLDLYASAVCLLGKADLLYLASVGRVTAAHLVDSGVVAALTPTCCNTPQGPTGVLAAAVGLNFTPESAASACLNLAKDGSVAVTLGSPADAGSAPVTAIIRP